MTVSNYQIAISNICTRFSSPKRWQIDGARIKPARLQEWLRREKWANLSPGDRDVPTHILTCKILNIQTSISFSAEASGRCWGFCKNSVVEEDIPETEAHQVITSGLATSQEGCHPSPRLQPDSVMCSYNADASDLQLAHCPSVPTAPLLHLAGLSPEVPPFPLLHL